MYILIGFASGLIIFPIGLWIFNAIRDAIERRSIKRMMKQGKFLTPIDPKDYDVEAWKNKDYGNINPDEHKEELTNLNNKIFKKTEEENDN
jgi:hypothetical protein